MAARKADTQKVARPSSRRASALDSALQRAQADRVTNQDRRPALIGVGVQPELTDQSAPAARPSRPSRPSRPPKQRRSEPPRPPESAQPSHGPADQVRQHDAAFAQPLGDLLAWAVGTAAQAGGSIVESLRAALSSPAVSSDIDAHLEFLRQRILGDYSIDEFGFDPQFTDRVLTSILQPLYRDWFRVEVRGIENIPSTGAALVVGNHSGVIAVDAVMTAVAIHQEHPQKRFLRMLAADLVFATPLVGAIARRGGATLASHPDVERLLNNGEVVGVWPEGFKGVGKPFHDRYRLQRFGRGGFVSAALRTGTPIIPCSIVGAEEIYPMIGNLPTLARLLGLPYVPITPTFPWLGPLGAIPLPSKWIIEFGEPIVTDTYDEQACEDPMVVFELTDQVRQTIQQTLYSLLMQRRSVFF